MAGNKRTCSVPECERKHYGHGYCQMHYKRVRATGSTEDQTHVPGHCSVDDCETVLSAGSGRGMCGKHYKRFMLHGDVNYVRPKVIGVESCTIDGCGKLIQAQTFCSAHLTRLYRNGDPDHRLQGEVVDGCRICPTCKVDKPLSEWTKGECLGCAALRSAAYRAANPDKTYTNLVLRQQRIRDAWDENVNRSEVFDRDGWVCGICDTDIDPTLKFPNRMSASLDHIIPIVLGGRHSYANTQAAHLTCNISKGGHAAA